MGVKPNHHWVLHIFDQIRDLGPVYGFWTFTGERLNKVIKSFRTNNHDGGSIETSFLRAFARDIGLRDMVRSSSLVSHSCVPSNAPAASLSRFGTRYRR